MARNRPTKPTAATRLMSFLDPFLHLPSTMAGARHSLFRKHTTSRGATPDGGGQQPKAEVMMPTEISSETTLSWLAVFQTLSPPSRR